MNRLPKLVLSQPHKDLLLKTVHKMNKDAANISNYNFRHFFLRKTAEKMAVVESATVMTASVDNTDH